LDKLSTQLYRLQADIANKAETAQNQDQSNGVITSPYLVQVSLFNPILGSYQLPATLEQYNNRVAVVNVPIDILSLQIIVLILFFVSLMANLLVERQSAAIAMLRNRGAVSMLALAQVARAPRQVVRMTMLLALATAFAIFTLVFSASQIQYSRDIAGYEAGADFSGAIPRHCVHSVGGCLYHRSWHDDTCCLKSINEPDAAAQRGLRRLSC